ncbi:MAG TPA: polysaccharide biosynthesis C-terminal domain-containing protein, partial [Oceanobacillus sp.]|nr:polysaccharide biosynthesis C-terminal domain-containing protein [Oceanobacillus sp.]
GEKRALSIDSSVIRRMTSESAPLMLNHFLATIFFQIDIVVIEVFHGSGMVGLYSVAYKWVMALNVIPSFFTQALLPIMSKQAHEDREGLKRNYTLAIKLLVSVALPTAVIFTFMATPLVALLGGAEFLPDSAIATQLMIWSIPIGWMNSLTQYVLIALDLQRHITRAFFVGVGFNIISNLVLIPQYGYRAAALTTIASEAALLIPFALLLQRALGHVDWLGMIWRPVIAAAAMFAVFALGWEIQPLLALVVGIGVYGGVWLGLRALTPEEWARLMPLIPARLRRRLVPGSA